MDKINSIEQVNETLRKLQGSDQSNEKHIFDMLLKDPNVQRALNKNRIQEG